MVYTKFDTYSEDVAPVLATAEGLRSPRGIELDPAYFTANANGNKFVKPGYFVSQIPGSVKGRVLPRTLSTGSTSTSQTAVSVKDAGIFVVGDVLSILAPSGRVTLTSASTGWAVGDTVTATINGVANVYTVVAGDVGGSLAATDTNVAAKLAALINASTQLYGKVYAVATAGVVLIFALDLASLYTLTAADTATNGTATASASALAAGASIGTIASINTSTDVITLAANASVAVQPGLPIGVANQVPVGMLAPNTLVDLTYRVNENFGLYTSASVYRNRLPYWDGDLAARFPEITLAFPNL